MADELRVSYKSILVLVSALLLVSVVVFRRDLPYSGGSLGPDVKPEMLLTLEDAYLVGSDAKGKLWSLKAKTVEMSRDRSETTIIRITDGRIFEQGKPLMKVDAGRAEYDQYTQDLKIGGGINLKGDSGQTAKCRGAIWNPRRSLLTTVGPVEYEDPSMRATASGLSVDLGSKEMTLTRPRIEVDLRGLVGGEEVER